MKKVASIDEYMRDFSPEDRAEYVRIAKITRQVVGEADEKISYGIPCLYYKGKMLIGFLVAKNHLSLFPGAGAIEQYSDELKEYELSKGTIHYQLDHLVPDDLVRKLIESRKLQIDVKAPNE